MTVLGGALKDKSPREQREEGTAMSSPLRATIDVDAFRLEPSIALPVAADGDAVAAANVIDVEAIRVAVDAADVHGHDAIGAIQLDPDHVAAAIDVLHDAGQVAIVG